MTKNVFKNEVMHCAEETLEKKKKRLVLFCDQVDCR